jgi:hypothetical protein
MRLELAVYRGCAGEDNDLNQSGRSASEAVMWWWSALAVVIGLLTGAGVATADEAAIADFYGEWQGVTAEVQGIGGVTPQDLSVTIRPDGTGFRMQWTELEIGSGGVAGRRDVRVSFDPTGQPGVFAYREEPGSMLERLFASPATSNPLEGETLLWARLVGPTLTVYSLALDHDGGFQLDRYEHTLQEGSMSYVGSRRTGRGPIAIVEGRLEPGPG